MSNPRYQVVEHLYLPNRWILQHGTDRELAWSIGSHGAHWSALDDGVIFSWSSREAALGYARTLFREPQKVVTQTGVTR